MSLEDSQKEGDCTPLRAQRCLFGSEKSSVKTKTKSSGVKRRKETDSSSEDSDLGPMSPIVFSDRSPSSCSSSPRYYYSPLATPQKISSPASSHLSWDRLTPNSNNNKHANPQFRSLRKITKAARNSPCRKLLLNSPRSSPHLLRENGKSPKTPEQSEMTMLSDEIIPETPQRNFGREIHNDILGTPSMSESLERRLITPIGSESKEVSLPKLHKRKSLSILLDTADYSSDRKENMLKRRAHESLGAVGTKLFKTDENSSIPKARAALFQDKAPQQEHNSKLKEFTLSTATFYKSSENKEIVHMFNIKKNLEQMKQRRSLPLQNSQNKRSVRRHTFGRINIGVSHGIKRPKPKKSPVSENKPKNGLTQSKSHENQSKSHENQSKLPSHNGIVIETDSPVISQKRPASPEIDPNKRFFKSKRAMQNNTTVTMNKKIKLKVSNGKFMLNAKHMQNARQPSKQQKLDISFDATDLTVDEPEMESSLQQCKVDNILKILEEDWADDDYDTMESLSNKVQTVPMSPMQSENMPEDVTMSPTSELSNLTSTMNIEDASAPSTFENISLNDTTLNIQKPTEPKYFPLFTKRYPAKNQNEVQSAKSLDNRKKSTNWQLTAKGGGGENQYQLDAGQKRFGASQCTDCGIVYQLGDPEDEMAHLNYHNSRNTLKFPGWKTERVIYSDPLNQSRILLIEPTDSKQCWHKVTSILSVVDRDLGLVDAKMSAYEQKKVYLYIRDKTVLGVLVAESIKTAHRMIPDLLELDCCTAESTPAKCGVNVIWTVMSHRGQGIASKLMDTLRTQFYYGYILTIDDIAFSIPTPSGKKFAEKYTKTRNFKVYS